MVSSQDPTRLHTKTMFGSKALLLFGHLPTYRHTMCLYGRLVLGHTSDGAHYPQVVELQHLRGPINKLLFFFSLENLTTNCWLFLFLFFFIISSTIGHSCVTFSVQSSYYPTSLLTTQVISYSNMTIKGFQPATREFTELRGIFVKKKELKRFCLHV